ncbi:hypothetical protein Q8A73_014560 [Channa argus]|nr:hypothetical protein Q8A73_014560 [Channa argus]
MSNQNRETCLCPIGNKQRKKPKREIRTTGAEPSADLQKQSTKHLNVSLKNRMGTDAHGGDGGLLNTERTTRSLRVSAHRAATSFGTGGRAGGTEEPQEENQRASARVPLETKRDEFCLPLGAGGSFKSGLTSHHTPPPPPPVPAPPVSFCPLPVQPKKNVPNIMTLPLPPPSPFVSHLLPLWG